MQLDDRVGILLGDRLDLDAALGRQHQQVLLGRTVEREAGVVLLVDVARMLDPHPLHDVALDVHAEDVAGVGAHLVGVVGELDAAGLAAAADLHLRLDDHRVAGRLGRGDRLVDGVGDAARGDRDVVAGEVLLALVLEQVHRSSVLPRLSRVELVLQPLAIPFSDEPGPKIWATPCSRSAATVGIGDDPAPEHQHVVEIARPSTLP